MHLIDITDYHTTLDLHADDLVTLAHACQFASLAATLPDLPTPFAALPTRPEAWGLLALFFEAAALASESGLRPSLQEVRAARAREEQVPLPEGDIPFTHVPSWPHRTEPGRKTDQESAGAEGEVLRRLHERAVEVCGEAAAFDLFAGVLGEGAGEEEAEEGAVLALPTSEVAA